MKHRQFGFTDDEVYPASASALGSNALHIHACPIIGQSQPYAACLKRIADYEAGQIQEAYTECRRAIGGPACTAYTMRAEEQKAGKALYYINRAKLQAHSGTIIASDLPRARISDVNPQPVSAPATAFAALSSGLETSYAAIINAEIGKLGEPA